jgi:hypothetical protein
MDHIDRLNKKLEGLKAVGDAEGIIKVEKEIEKRQLEYAGKQFIKQWLFHPTLIVDAVVLVME